MRLKRTNLILGSFMVIWALVLYFAFLTHLTNTNENNGNVDKQIMMLEQGISEQFKINNDMIHDARRFLERKKTQGDAVAGKQKDFQDFKLPILVFACNRVSVSKCLDRLIQYRPDPDKFPIIVSQVSTTIFATHFFHGFLRTAITKKPPKPSKGTDLKCRSFSNRTNQTSKSPRKKKSSRGTSKSRAITAGLSTKCFSISILVLL